MCNDDVLLFISKAAAARMHVCTFVLLRQLGIWRNVAVENR